MPARLTMICHASTAAIRKPAFPADEPLDDQGKTSTAVLVKHLPRPDRCWTSPELRSRQTAEALHLDATVEERLRDFNYGSWTGRSFDEISSQEPEAVARWLHDPEARPHGGDSIATLMQRVAAWIDGQNGVTGQAIVVTHASIIRAAIVHAIDATLKSFWRVDISPLSVTRFSGNNGRWNLISVIPMQSIRT